MNDETTVDEDIISNETRLTRIQALVVEILNNLLRAPIEQTDAAVEEAIARLGDYCRRDRTYVFVHHGEITQNTHEWCAEGIDPMIDHLQELPIELYGPIAEDLGRGDVVHVPDVNELPADSPSRLTLEEQSVRSILLVPMRSEGSTYGFVGFDGVHKTHSFLPGEVYLLQSVADVICSVLIRREQDTDMRIAQQELADERAFLSSITSTSAMGIVVIDTDGIINFVNNAAESMLGVPSVQMLGSHHEDPAFFGYRREDGSTIPAGETPFDLAMRTGVLAPVERLQLATRDGGEHFVSIHAAPVVQEGGTRARVVYALIDVTDQTMAERKREEALEEANRANTAKSNFLAKMSHEMRTPLNGVLGVAEVLEKLINDPDQRRMVKVMHESGALLLSIINDLLDMSKIEADLMEIEVVPFIPTELAQRIESVHTLKASEKRISFGVSVTGDGDSARLGDPHRILQIMHNVVSNAIKFTENGSVGVEIDCGASGELTMTVRDTGIGMTEAQLSHLFEDFGQADSSIARRFGGTGLGMPIVNRLVDMMQGKISVETIPNAGTTIVITLPVPRTDLPDMAVPAPDPALVAPDLQALRVLAADDNRTNRMILAAMMGQLGIAAVLVNGGSEALEAYEREAFDLVILDISMPDMDGVTVQKEIRTREARRVAEGDAQAAGVKALPIVAFTANAMAHQVESYLREGFDDCLTKPLHLDRLRESLSALIADRGRRCPAPSTQGVVPLRRSSG
ncbi:ATP-binding protein [Pararhodobacter marinus]|uniref:ATP-binding protein n=1 Tax=Pararhodobacter marinus TaxID=2184063 RepID=UPI0035122C0A